AIGRPAGSLRGRHAVACDDVMMMAMVMMMFPRVSGLRECHKANDGDRKGHRLHAVTPTHLHSMFCFLRQQTKTSPSVSKARPSKRKRLVRSRRGRSHSSNEDFFPF